MSVKTSPRRIARRNARKVERVMGDQFSSGYPTFDQRVTLGRLTVR